MMIDEIGENKIFESTMCTEKQQPQKLGQTISQDKRTTTAKLLQGSSGARAKIGQIIQQDKPNTTAQLLQGSSGAI